MRRESLPWILTLLAICCLSSGVAAQRASKKPALENAYGEEFLDEEGREAEDDEYEGYEIRAYQVADLLIPTPDYPYRAGDLLGRGGQEPTYGGMGGFGGMGGWGGGMGAGAAPSTDGGAGMGQPGMGGFRPPARAAGRRLRKGEPFARDIDDLIEVIWEVVDPEGWDHVGGPGTVGYFGGFLFIRQLPENHRKIEDLLDTIRSEGGAAQVVIFDAHWLLLDSAELAALVGDDSADPGGKSPLAIDPATLKKLAQEAPGYRGRITCFSGQTVHLASGSRRSVVIGAIPVVGSAPAYQPLMAYLNLGVVLEVTPSLLPGTEEAILDVHSTVTKWRPPDPPVQIGSLYPSTRRVPEGAGEIRETPGGSASIEVDRLNVPMQQLETTLRVPLGKPVLVGGLTLEPTESASGQKTQRDGKQLYLVVRISAAKESRPDQGKPQDRSDVPHPSP